MGSAVYGTTTVRAGVVIPPFDGKRRFTFLLLDCRVGAGKYFGNVSIMAEAGVPYLIAVPPRGSRRPLDPETRDWRPPDDGPRAVH